jgi:hypothetical protein
MSNVTILKELLTVKDWISVNDSLPAEFVTVPVCADTVGVGLAHWRNKSHVSGEVVPEWYGLHDIFTERFNVQPDLWMEVEIQKPRQVIGNK